MSLGTWPFGAELCRFVRWRPLVVGRRWVVLGPSPRFVMPGDSGLTHDSHMPTSSVWVAAYGLRLTARVERAHACFPSYVAFTVDRSSAPTSFTFTFLTVSETLNAVASARVAIVVFA